MNLIKVCSKGSKVATAEVSREAYVENRNSYKNRMNLIEAHKGNDEAKRNLIQYNYNDLMPDGVVAGACHPSSFFAGDVDCESIAECKELAKRFLDHKEEIELMELSRSANYGLHYVCRRQKGRTILENQVRVSMITRTEMDTNAHDLARVMFTVTADPDELLYLNDELFHETMTVEESELEYEVLKMREEQGLEEVPAGAKQKNKHYRPWLEMEGSLDGAEYAGTPAEAAEGAKAGTPAEAAEGAKAGTPAEVAEGQEGLKFKDLLYSDIIAKWWAMHGGEPQKGERNTGLHKLAVHLRTICDNDPKLLFQVMPHLGLSDSEVRSIIASATKEQPKGITLEMKTVVCSLQKSAETKSVVDVDMSSHQPPQMPKKLPRLIKLLTSKAPDLYKPTIAHAVFPSLAAHLWKVKFRYIDNQLHEATLMNLLVAESGAGKSCINEPIDHIIADIKRRDEITIKREQAWKDEVNSKAMTKDKAKRPEGLVQQILAPDMTNAAFVMKTHEAEERFLYTHMNEIEQFDALKGNGRGSNQFQIMCLTFDGNATYGQVRVGSQSVSYNVVPRLLWNASTTPKEARLYFRPVLVNGPVQRINICTIPPQPIGAEIPVFKDYDAAFDEELKPYIDNLCAIQGEIACPQAFKLAKELDQECKMTAIESQSKTYDDLSHRANVIAYLKACVLYVANGCKWEKSIEDFIRWSLEYDLWCKMELFGDAITAANHYNGPSNSQPKSLCAELPPVFSEQQVFELYAQKSLDPKGIKGTIRQWKHRNLILEQEDGSYKQLKYC